MIIGTKLLNLRCITLALLVLLAVNVNSSHALLLDGTSVTGSLTFGIFTTNHFDPTNGSVPSGCGNSSPGGTTVVIGSGDEFCYENVLGGLNITVDFSDSALSIELIKETVSDLNSVHFEFTNSSFSGIAISEPFDGFPVPGLSCNLAGTTLSCDWPGAQGLSQGFYSALYFFTPVTTAVPAPGSLALLGLGLLALGFARRRRQQ